MIWEVGGEIRQLPASIETPDTVRVVCFVNTSSLDINLSGCYPPFEQPRQVFI